MFIIVLWSLVIYYTKPESIYGPKNSFKGRTFNFWLAFWIAAIIFYLIEHLTQEGQEIRSLDLKGKLLTLAVSLVATDINSILLLGVYSSYTRAKDFTLGGFLRSWIPLWCILAIYVFLWVVFRDEFGSISPKSIRFLMITPSLSLGMLAAFCLGWGFHRQLGRGAVISLAVSVPWALIQMPLYYLFWVEEDVALGSRLLWGLVFLKIFVAVMFFTYITFQTRSEDSVIRPSENIPFPQVVRQVFQWLGIIVGGLLACIKLFELLRNALFR
jgi:hypothetical protein